MKTIETAYLVPSATNVVVKPLLTVTESPDGMYPLAGVPDGLGILRLNDHYFDLVCTHEIFFNEGARRAHAASGAFVSRWRVDTQEWDNGNGRLNVIRGWDQIKSVDFWNHRGSKFGSGKKVPLERLCSADLPPQSSLYFREGDKEFGARERIFLGGEETTTKYKLGFGRAWAHIVTGPHDGKTLELPHLGRISFENVVCCPQPQLKTIAVGLDDATAHTGDTFLIREPTSELYVYVGTKKEIPLDPGRGEKPNPEQVLANAGLFGGDLYGVKVSDGDSCVAWENEENGFGDNSPVYKAKFVLESLGDRSKDFPHDKPGIALQKDSLKKGITQFLRIEDGAWDPRPEHTNEFYFVTTHEYDGNSRLFRLIFDDISAPEIGGTIQILLNGKSPTGRRFQMLDSITVDSWGRVFLQEDTGGKSYVTRTLMYLPETEKLFEVCAANESVFRDQSNPLFLTNDEESAGIIPAFDTLGDGWYITAVQGHHPVDDWPNRVSQSRLSPEQSAQIVDELLEPGQILAIYVPKGAENELPEV